LVSTAAILRDLCGDAPPVPEEKRATFFAITPEGDPSAHSSSTLLDSAVGELPSLPEIRSEQLAQRIFTHGSLTAGLKYPFQAPDDDANADNEE